MFLVLRVHVLMFYIDALKFYICSNVLGFNVLCFNVPSFNDLYSNVPPSVLIIFVLMLRILYSNVLCSVF